MSDVNRTIRPADDGPVRFELSRADYATLEQSLHNLHAALDGMGMRLIDSDDETANSEGAALRLIASGLDKITDMLL